MAPETFNTSRLFLRTLVEAGIKVVFVNLGSDHPALVHAFSEMKGDGPLRIITAPNEMVALSAAQGYAQISGFPAAVIVHVDAGTLAMGQAIHNVDRSRTPCLIYAGMSPYSLGPELRGGRNEFIFWWQDVHDQPSIVRQYMRYTGQIHDGRTVQHNVMRALQFATSEPKGPVYLHARREAMEQVLNEEEFMEAVNPEVWGPVRSGNLPDDAAEEILQALLSAKQPLFITTYLGKDPKSVPLLVELAEKLGFGVQTNNASNVNFPSNHSCFLGNVGGMEPSPLIRNADVILVVDCEVPWIPMHNEPSKAAKIFHIDVDPLKSGMQSFHIPARMRYKANSNIVLQQLLSALKDRRPQDLQEKLQRLKEAAERREAGLKAQEVAKSKSEALTVQNLLGALARMLPMETVVVNESITSFGLTWNHLRPKRPASMFTSGGAALGWSLGAVVGMGLAEQTYGLDPSFFCVIVGDGSFLFTIPSVSYWMARRYAVPHLTIVLNNGGYKAPKGAAMRQYPDSLVATGPADNLFVTFPEEPAYEKIAEASGGAWGKCVSTSEELEEAILEGIRVVKVEKRCACLNVHLEKL